MSVMELLDLLVPPLSALDALPDHRDLASRHGEADGSIDASRFVKRQLGLVQKVLVERVWPDWEGALEADEGRAALAVFERFFLPASTIASSNAATNLANDVALSAYAVLSSLLSVKSAATLRPRVRQLYRATFCAADPASSGAAVDDEDEVDPASLSRWEHGLKDVLAVPTRVANAWGSSKEKHRLGQIPAELEESAYCATLAASYLELLWDLAADQSHPAYPSVLAQLLAALLSFPTFLQAALPRLVPRLLPPSTFPSPAAELLRRHRHTEIWRKLAAELSERDLNRWLRLVLQGLSKDLSKPSDDLTSGAAARAAAFVLDALVGPLTPSNVHVWRAALGVLFEPSARWEADLVAPAVVRWAGDDVSVMTALLQAVMDVWGRREEIRSGSDSRRLFLTSLFLHLVVSSPPHHADLTTLSRSPAFLSAISTHLSLVNPLSRLLGMLVAEVVSARTVKLEGELKPLSFGDEIWSGDAPAQVQARGLREALKRFSGTEKGEGWQDVLRRRYANEDASPPRQAPSVKVNTTPMRATSIDEPAVEPAPRRPLISIIDSDNESDDDLTPYPLPPAPSDSTLEALSSADPSLYHSAIPSQSSATSGPAGTASQTRRRGKLRPPVYIPELAAYLRGQDPQGSKEEADGEAERVEMGLKEGEALVRRKAGWGGELRENAVDLAFALMALQNQFELDDFERLKQDILTALIAACPAEVAPAVIEQYFTTSYSVSQRHVLLAALALAARELAGLPPPPGTPENKQRKVEAPPFPSKQLPPALHRRLLGNARGEQAGPLEALTADLTQMALSGARQDAEETLPGAAREKLLSVRRSTTRTPASLAASRSASATTQPTYSSLAAGTFILPLVNRFWLYLRDTATSSLSTRAASVGPYAGGSSAPILLEPLLLSKFLATLAVLVHAARHSPAFLAVLVPEVLAFVLAIRPSAPSPVRAARTRTAAGDDEDDGGLDEDLVTSSALELVLVALDATVQLDGGRTLMSSSAANGGGGEIVVSVKEWAEEVFEREDRRGGDMGVGRPGRAAAGVLLRVEDIVGKWRLSVGW
ncbi:hypothetical protein Rhopal_002856-T1 [Rhodotorula paludigena]|uniref:Telomere length regulation protein conserved domain-containing protein n=1 Tax=Rhodotorula paludigena TaxID=86838 RepID=A0AAV5GK83_9BASI|nr:hypothetical protein Rhopal_002856-T1 [Rhodotorula paludigena]